MAFVTVTQTLEKWFGKPLSKLPHEEQMIAMAYIKAWDTLTPILRRERAKEIDRQRAVKLRIKHDSIRRKRKLDMENADPVEGLAWVHVGYYGEAHVRMWLSMGSVSTLDAALLFHGENPSSYKGYDMGPDFNDMKKSFDDVDGKRNLAGWIAVARQRNLQAVCVEGWAACAKLFAQDVLSENGATVSLAGTEEVSNESTRKSIGAPYVDSGPCAVFLAMTNLTANELRIIFVDNQDGSGLGANSMLEVSARGETRRLALVELGLAKRRGAGPNGEGAMLSAIAKKIKVPKTVANEKKVSRLKSAISQRLGVVGNLFERYRRNAGWVPLFNLEDHRGKGDKRSKQIAESRRTVSFESLGERGIQLSELSKEELEEAADDILKANGSGWGDDAE